MVHVPAGGAGVAPGGGAGLPVVARGPQPAFVDPMTTQTHDDVLDIVGVTAARAAVAALRQRLTANPAGIPFADWWNAIGPLKSADQWVRKLNHNGGNQPAGSSKEHCARALFMHTLADGTWSANAVNPAPAGI